MISDEVVVLPDSTERQPSLSLIDLVFLQPCLRLG